MSDRVKPHFIVKEERVEKLKELFPEAVGDGEINWDLLKESLGEFLEDESQEHFGLNWPGKQEARKMAFLPPKGALKYAKGEGLDEESTENLFIEGDNLEVLKLLQKSYFGKVKMIYIDPPYNTGNDFVYSDNFTDTIEDYLRKTGQLDEEGKPFSTNPKTSGRFHSNWLNMMYPRLMLARNLLRDDGVIFISIDEGEHTRLRSIMDEIFGGENFVSDMVWAAGRKNDSKLISVSHEYIVCYAKDKTFLSENKILWRQRKKGLDDIYDEYNRLKKLHSEDFSSITASLKEWFKNLADGHPSKAHKHYCQVDSRGIYFAADISWPGGGGPKYEILHPTTNKPVKVPSRGWITPDENKMKNWIAENRVHFGIDETSVPCLKKYLKDSELQTPYSVFYQDGRAASKRLRSLMGESCFDFPKDEKVLQELVAMLTDEGDVILDFFAGSGTCGHSVMLQNALDKKSRMFLIVQLPEPLYSTNKSQKVGVEYCNQIRKPHNLAELAKERIRRASDKIKKENPDYTGDLGFKVLKLSESNIIPWDDAKTTDLKQLELQLENSVNPVRPDAEKEDLLIEVLLWEGFSLTSALEKKKAGSNTFIAVTDKSKTHKLWVCLDEQLDFSLKEFSDLGFSKESDDVVIFLDSSLQDTVKSRISDLCKLKVI